MTLAEWLKAKEISNAEFGLRIKRTAEAVRRYASGERIPDKGTMPLIAQATEGAVTANDFFGIKTPARKAA